VTRAFALVAPLLLGACTIWPPAGTGGWAEHQPETTFADTRLVIAQHHFERLATGEPGRQWPAAIVQTRVLLVRAMRSSAADLEPAAQSDLVTLEDALNRLEDEVLVPRALIGSRESAS